ncbi:MAG: glycolate oxidase subunit GlcF [Halioglobus sp.]
MHIKLHHSLSDDPRARQAQQLTRACVHCGFCLETCPTYLDQRDERDSPRGRIYLIKQLMEEGEASSNTLQHLDRCLTCRSCETTCPSGMRYGELLDIGREVAEQAAPRPLHQRLMRWLLRKTITTRPLLHTGLAMARLLRPLLPPALATRIPLKKAPGKHSAGKAAATRTMIILEGCVQEAATPQTNAAARRLLGNFGIALVSASKAGCCGALNHHLSASADARREVRRNIDAWWPLIENGAEAIISSASGCGAMLADYGRLLADDPAYADKAARVAALSCDLAQVVSTLPLDQLSLNTAVGKVSVHTPCTLQHALGQAGTVEAILRRAGFELANTRDNHLCCGSAGSYSLLQKDISARLREKKLDALTADNPALIVSANIGCQLHLHSADGPPVLHWIELLEPTANH